MMWHPLVCCEVDVFQPGAAHGVSYNVDIKHYEELKRILEGPAELRSGWVELDGVHGDGKLFIRATDIAGLFYAGQAYNDERDQWEQDRRAKGLTE